MTACALQRVLPTTSTVLSKNETMFAESSLDQEMTDNEAAAEAEEVESPIAAVALAFAVAAKCVPLRCAPF